MENGTNYSGVESKQGRAMRFEEGKSRVHEGSTAGRAREM